MRIETDIVANEIVEILAKYKIPINAAPLVFDEVVRKLQEQRVVSIKVKD